MVLSAGACLERQLDLKTLVDLSSHNTNPPGVFDGAPYELRDSSDDRDEEALASIRAFLEEFGVRPTAEAWTATGTTPSEKTIRRRFGSFRSAVARANALPPSATLTVPKSSTAITQSRL